MAVNPAILALYFGADETMISFPAPGLNAYVMGKTVETEGELELLTPRRAWGNNVAFSMPLFQQYRVKSRKYYNIFLHSIRVTLFTQFFQFGWILLICLKKYLSLPIRVQPLYHVGKSADSTSQYLCQKQNSGFVSDSGMLG